MPMVSLKEQITRELSDNARYRDELLDTERIIDLLPEALALLPYNYVRVDRCRWGTYKYRINVHQGGHDDKDWVPLMKQAWEREAGVIFDKPAHILESGTLVLEGEWQADNNTLVEVTLFGAPTKKCVKVKMPKVVPATPAVEAIPEQTEWVETYVCPGKELPAGAILLDDEANE